MKVTSCVGTVLLAVKFSEGFIASHFSSLCRKNHVKACSNTLWSKNDMKDEEEVYVAGEITEGNTPNKFEERFLDRGVLTTEETKSRADPSAGPLNYDGLIDGDSFDGGDGQVGVVGDGSNAMETFDQRSTSKVLGATIVTQSKDRQMNAWGSNSGYADTLKEQGMVDIDQYGEDKLKVKRQQLENWRNQQELQKQQRSMLREMGDEEQGTSWKRGAGRSYMDNLSGGVPKDESAWNEFKPPTTTSTKSDGSNWATVKLTGRERIKETVTCISRSGRPGVATIQVKNTVMTFEPFNCQFSGDAEGFSVDPQTGTLNRRGGEPIPVNVSFKSNGPGDARDVLLVVQTEGDKFVYAIEGRTE